MRHGNPLPRHPASGILLVVVSAFAIGPATRFPGWAALAPVLGAALLLAAGPAAPASRILLSNRIAVFLGLISYPLYLWHWPIVSFAHVIMPEASSTKLAGFSAILLSTALAWATWRFVEMPLRRPDPWRAMSLVVAMMLAGAAGLVVWASDGFPGRHANHSGVDIAKIGAAVGDGIFMPTPGMTVENRNESLITKFEAGGEGVLFTGDSLVFHYAPRVEALFQSGLLRQRTYFVVGASCAPFPGIVQTGYFSHCRELPDLALEVLGREPIRTVVIGASWPGYTGTSMQIERGGRRMTLDDPAGQDAMYANLEDHVRRLVALGLKVSLVLAVPVHQNFDPRTMISRSPLGLSIEPERLRPVPVARLREAARKVDDRLVAIASRTGATVVDPLPDICGPGPDCALFFEDWEPKYADSMHLRPAFVRENVRMFDALLTQ